MGISVGEATIAILLDIVQFKRDSQELRDIMIELETSSTTSARKIQAALTKIEKDTSTKLQAVHDKFVTLNKDFENAGQSDAMKKFGKQLAERTIPKEFFDRISQADQALLRMFERLSRGPKGGEGAVNLFSPQDLQRLMTINANLNSYTDRLRSATGAQVEFNARFKDFFDRAKRTTEILAGGQLNIWGSREKIRANTNEFLKGSAALDRYNYGLKTVSKSGAEVGGSLQGLLKTVGKLAPAMLAAFGVTSLLREAANGIKGLIGLTTEYYDTLHRAQSLFIGFAGGLEPAGDVMKNIMAYARNANVPFKDMVDGASQLAPILARSGESTENLLYYLDQARRLMLADPTKGMSQAIFSIAELLGGDFVSLQRNFRITKEDIDNLAELEGLDRIEAFNLLLDQSGQTSEIASEAVNTFANAFDRLRDAAGLITQSVFGPLLQNALLPFLNTIVEGTFRVADFFSQLQDSGAGVMRIGAAFANIAKEWAKFMTALLPGYSLLKKIGELITSFGGGILRQFLSGGIFAGTDNLAEKLARIISVALKAGSLVIFAVNTLRLAVMTFTNALLEGAQNLVVAIRNLVQNLFPKSQAGEAFNGLIRALGDEIQNNLETRRALSAETVAMMKEVEEITRSLDNFQFTAPSGQGDLTYTPPDSSAVEDFTDEAVMKWLDFQKEIQDLNDTYFEEQARKQADFLRKQEQAVEDYNLKRSRMIEDAQIDEAQRLREFERDKESIISGADSEAEKLIQKREESRKEKIVEFQQEEERDLDEHQRKLRRMKEDHEAKLLEAAARLDAFAVAQENEKYARDRAREMEDFAVKQDQKRQQLQQEISMEDAAFQARLEVARQHDRERLADLERSFAEEEKQRAAELELKLARMEEDFAIQQAREEEQFKQQILLDEQRHQQRLQKANEQFAREMNQLISEGNKKLEIEGQFLEASRRQLEAWWDANADLYLPPEFERTSSSSNNPYDRPYLGGGTNTGSIQVFADGGTVGQTGLALVHRGEEVINPTYAAAMRGIMGGRVDQAELVRTLQNGSSGGGSGGSIFSAGSINIEVNNAGNMSPEEIQAIVRAGLVEAFEELA